MLTRMHKILLAMLVVQIGLAAVTLRGRDDSAVDKPHAVLKGFDAAAVTQLAVYAKDGAKPTTVLAKRGDTWVVSSSFDYPVAQTKLTELLASFAKMSAASPIATQASRHKQLRVADSEFERKVVITSAGGETTLLFGAQAGSRRTALRRGGDSNVYAIAGLNTWSIGTEPRDWVEPSYVKVGPDDVAKIVVERAGVRNELERDGSQWKATMAGAPIKLAAGESIDASAIQRIVTAATSIDLRAPGDPKRDATNPTATITVVRKAATNPPESTASGANAATTGAPAAGVAGPGSVAPGSTGPASAVPSTTGSVSAGASTAPPEPIVIDIVADGESYWVRDRASARPVMVEKARLADVVELSRDKLVTKPAPPQAKASGNPTAPPPEPTIVE